MAQRFNEPFFRQMLGLVADQFGITIDRRGHYYVIENGVRLYSPDWTQAFKDQITAAANQLGQRMAQEGGPAIFTRASRFAVESGIKSLQNIIAVAQANRKKSGTLVAALLVALAHYNDLFPDVSKKIDAVIDWIKKMGTIAIDDIPPELRELQLGYLEAARKYNRERLELAEKFKQSTSTSERKQIESARKKLENDFADIKLVGEQVNAAFAQLGYKEQVPLSDGEIEVFVATLELESAPDVIEGFETVGPVDVDEPPTAAPTTAPPSMDAPSAPPSAAPAEPVGGADLFETDPLLFFYLNKDHESAPKKKKGAPKTAVQKKVKDVGKRMKGKKPHSAEPQGGAKKDPERWRKHVKAFAKEHNLGFFDALKKAKASYKG